MSLKIAKDAGSIKNLESIIVLLPEGKVTLPKEYKEFAGVLADREFTGKKYSVESINLLKSGKLTTYVFAGLGDAEALPMEQLKRVLATAYKLAHGATLIVSPYYDVDADIVGDFAEHVSYKFDKYKSDKKPHKPAEIYLIGKSAKAGAEGTALGKIINVARDLVNEPAIVMTPAVLADNATALAREYGFDIKVLGLKDIQKLKMGAFLAVGSGSDNEPRFIIMRHNGDPKSKEIMGLVGKGLCYDSGGYSIKPTDSMLTMKHDMTGAATVIAVMCALAKQKVKKNVVAVVAACENMISGHSYKPGDVVTSMSGITIEVNNTDAEGRLTLADALTYIITKEKVDQVIDVATLTGAITVALGNNITGVFGNNTEATGAMHEALTLAGAKWGERFWAMPMDEEFDEMINGTVGDILNSTGRPGGSSTAAKFLERFVGKTPWLHLDIAGTAYAEKEGKYYNVGATGEVVKTLYTYIKEF